MYLHLLLDLIFLINEANDDNHETTDTPRTDKDYALRTNIYDSIENMKATKKINDDDK